MGMRAVVVVVLLGASEGITAKSSVACKIVNGEEEQEGERGGRREREGRKRERRTRNQNVSFMHHGCFNVVHLRVRLLRGQPDLRTLPQKANNAGSCVLCGLLFEFKMWLPVSSGTTSQPAKHQ